LGIRAVKALNFRNIGLIGRPGKRSVVDTLQRLHDFLEARGLKPIYDEQTAQLADPGPAQVVSRALLGEVCDLVIVVGGDGSLLHAARALARHKTPVLGVNRGRLGFLTDVSPRELLDKLGQVLAGEYTLDRRFLLQVEVRGADSKVRYEATALNDIVLHSGKSVHMLDFELTIDGHHVYRQHSDGLIIATPTGSTAYALSGGGPILHPNLDAVVLVPMHPHTLSSRPIVVGGESEIKLRVHDSQWQPMISADGQPSVMVSDQDRIHIRKHPFKLTLLHPPGYDFYAACRTKLGWSHYQDPKQDDADEH
jgi:NAD+ kinase